MVQFHSNYAKRLSGITLANGESCVAASEADGSVASMRRHGVVSLSALGTDSSDARQTVTEQLLRQPQPPAHHRGLEPQIIHCEISTERGVALAQGICGRHCTKIAKGTEKVTERE